MIDLYDFVGALSDDRILPRHRGQIVFRDMLSQCAEVSILAQELVYREWFTPFQMERILQGQAETLVVGPYLLLDILGEGGMGTVYKAVNPRLNKIVAVKVLREDRNLDPAILARFIREIHAIGRLDHPNIVCAFDCSKDDDIRPYYAMEYVPGIDLGRYVMRHGPVAVSNACYYMLQAAHALEYANHHNLVHRDIKPTNLLLDENRSLIKLLDLGLTRTEVPVEDSFFAEITKVGLLVGTPDFMSPEQIEDSRKVDIRSDIYGLGCTFYYLLAGFAPFAHVKSQVEKLEHQYEREPAPIESLRDNLPSDVAKVVRRMMAKSRRKRYASPKELIKDLEQLCGEFPRKRRTEDSGMPSTPARASVSPLVDPSQNSLPSTEVSRSALMYRFAPSSCLEMFQEPVVPEEPKQIQQSRYTLNPVRVISAVLLGTLGLIWWWPPGKGPVPDVPNEISGDVAQPPTPTNEPPVDLEEVPSELSFEEPPEVATFAS